LNRLSNVTGIRDAARPRAGCAGFDGSITEDTMNRSMTLGIAMLAGATVGAAAVQGLHAQAKPKAYLVTEIEVLGVAAADAYGALVRPTQTAAGGRVSRMFPV
jgi:hypothetical protein